MNVHEYQAKELLKQYGVPVLENRVIFKPEDAEQAAKEFVEKGSKVVVLKSQVHAGGRGKGKVRNINTDEIMQIEGKDVHGVNVLFGDNLPAKAKAFAEATLGNKLVTIQTGEAGSIVNRMMLEDGASIDKEFYISILLDRATSKNIIMASTEGGVEIEEVAEHSPEKILKEIIDPTIGFQGYQARRLAFGLGLSGTAFKNFVKFISNLIKAYDALDCSMLEINPLVVTTDELIIALDAKVDFDDNALYRHPSIAALRDESEEAPLEVEASKYDLNYIKLDGNVGCMVNGAGLAMATMDMIKLSGGEPANFLDVGGGANVERIANAFRIMMSDENVEAVLINIFGGIVRCDRVANGIIQALETVEVNLPLIVRLDGTNAELAADILDKSDLKFIVAKTFNDAAEKVAAVVKTLKV
ncbi:MAG: ADP-forming succinate--CoA ligase subunit beta [Ignavibacteriae bacterium HGW-Ignavibacteriae-4]|jgi:succinyl-CoA synthetase beta subunit|nr:MAG: ADP-forming succinate--CoA ligase subunit beta [Ignavibacteriae bacterium HGW-Ignavibacteriae-4]